MQHRELIASRRSDVPTAMLRSSSGRVPGASEFVRAVIALMQEMHFIDPRHIIRIIPHLDQSYTFYRRAPLPTSVT
jgi:hypothetical protein